METLERRSKPVTLAAVLLILFCSHCKEVEGHRNTTKMSYVCPPDFIRLGHSCYFFSENKSTWHNALFSCKDKESELSVPARWEDRHLRKYLNTPELKKASRWIGGIYDYSARAWKWGGALQQMRYQSFSKMKKMTHEQLQWHCIAMIPDLNYRWSPRNCYEPHQYICQTKLRKVPKSKLKEIQRRYQRMGKINDITAPSISREVNDAHINDVTSNPVLNPKSYDLRPSPLRRPKDYQRNAARNLGLRPNELKKRSRPNAQRRLKRPFPGYQWNRRDPEASYQYNAELLKSGRTGLSPQQVKVHLSRLRHMRDKQVERRKRLRSREDWLVNDQRPGLIQTHARTYTIDNNISALHPKTIVEQFDMLLPPSMPVVLPRPARGAG